MKAQLARHIPPSFSFSPSEIARFIRPQPNMSHALDVTVGAKIWEEVGGDFAQRIAFAKILGARIAAGQHDCERWSYADRHRHDPALFYQLGSNATTSHNRIDGLSEALLARSRSTAGRWSADKAKPARVVRLPSTQQFAQLDARNSGESRWWRESGPDWRCPGCDRSKFEIMRQSNKGAWRAALMVKIDFELETDAARLARRAVYHDGPMFLGAHRQIVLCQDCRQMQSDILTIRPGIERDCLNLMHIRSLANPAIAHSRHAATAEDIGAAINANVDWIAAITDYRCHQRRALEIGFEHYRLMKSTGCSAHRARDLVIPKLVETNRLPGADSIEWFDWWMNEDERLRAIDREKK